MGSAHSTIEDTSEKKNNNKTNNNINNNNSDSEKKNIVKNFNKDDYWGPVETTDFILEQPNNFFKTENNQCEKNKDNNKIIENLSESHLPINNNIELGVTNEIDEATINLNCTTKREQTLEEFKEELRLKRMARSTAVDSLRNEITKLRQELANEKELTRRLKNGESIEQIDIPDINLDLNQYEDHNCEYKNEIVAAKEKNKFLQTELAETQYHLQIANADNLTKDTELKVVRKHVISLKEVIVCTKQMIEIREEQVNQLKAKIHEIEQSLAERELKIMSDDLRKEYDKQLENIRNLRQLYEERARVCAAERENLQSQIQIKKDELSTANESNKTLEEKILHLEQNLQTSNDDMENVKTECKRYLYQYQELQEEITVINKLFSQMLMGFNGTNCLDIDRLTIMLEENRTLLKEMAIKEEKYEGASLPKLLFDIVTQVNNSTATNSNIILEENDEKNAQQPSMIESNIVNVSNDTENEINEAKTTNKKLSEHKYSMESTLKSSLEKNINSEDNGYISIEKNIEKVASAQEIISNLPKVWKVLMELLSHHKIEKVEILENGQSEDCYKFVQTPNGLKSELSVSKTYIKLKDLILEKKSLLKDSNRIKTLNNHLEYRLNEQEKRLSTVSLELTKTWHLVGKMQRQHRQLHTHEQILRYQLHQKRRLLNELKEELEYCRRKWQAARAKNTESQLQCDEMRKEFAKRKLEDANNSAESGYSDGPGSDEDEIDRTKNIDEPISYRNLFDKENINRKIERMQSCSPTPITVENALTRSQSAPDNIQILNNVINAIVEQPIKEDGATCSSISNGAIPKHEIQSILNGKGLDPKKSERTIRMERLEEQCKSLIAKVLETSNCREKLEIQLCRFQDEMAPAQHPIPLDEFISRKTDKTKSKSCPAEGDECVQGLEKEPAKDFESHVSNVHSRYIHSREGSVGAAGTIQEEPIKKDSDDPTEDDTAEDDSDSILSIETQEYINRRSERLKRLEKESRNLLLKLSKTADRGKKISLRIDELHSLYGSEESDIEPNVIDSSSQSEEVVQETIENRLKNMDEASSKRTERLRIMEEESQKLLSKLNKTSDRGSAMIKHLDENQKKKTEDNIKKDLEKIEIEKTRQQNIASSSMVSEEMNEIIIITQTSTQIAQTRGARPKIYKEPTGIAALQLSCSKKKKMVEKNKNEESLEEMVLRLTTQNTEVGNSSNSSGNLQVEEEIPQDTEKKDEI